MVTRAWKVYGAEGHRQRESFRPSCKYDFSTENNIRIIEVENGDKTGTNDYSIIRITRNTFEDCEREFFGQLTDGIFENSRTGKTEEIINSNPLGYGYTLWGGEIRDILPHGARYYMNGRRW